MHNIYILYTVNKYCICWHAYLLKIYVNGRDFWNTSVIIFHASAVTK